MHVVNSNKLCIFLASSVPFKVDFSRIRDLKVDLVLICLKELYDTLPMYQKMNFMNIYVTSALNLENFISIIELFKNDKKWPDVCIVSCDEFVVALGAELREHYGLLGDYLGSIKAFSDKIIMKEKLKDSNVRIPRYTRFDADGYLKDPQGYANALSDYLKLPIFCKPIQSAGSKDTRILYTQEDVMKWCEAHKESVIPYECDEFIFGELYHCDSVIQDGKVLRSFVCKYTVPCHEYVEGKASGSLMIPEECSLFSRICSFNNRVLKALEVPPRTVTHLELYRTIHNELIFIEVAARPPGAFIPYIYEKAYGVNLQEVYSRLQIDPTYNFQRKAIALKCYAADCSFPLKAGAVHSLNKLPYLNSQYYIEWRIKPGQRVENSTDITSSSFNILLWNKNYEKLKEDINDLVNFIPYNTIKPEILEE